MADVNLRIKEICKEKGITLESLAKRLGILRTSLAQAMSRDSFSTKKLGEIADALGVPVWQLFISADEVLSSQAMHSFDGLHLSEMRCTAEADSRRRYRQILKFISRYDDTAREGR